VAVTLADLAAQAQELSPEDRARLAEMLLESLHGAPAAEIADAWDREVEARVAAFERGESQTYPADEVFAEAKRLTQ
jgi:putative addiction module component (TIGR02574 family)